MDRAFSTFRRRRTCVVNPTAKVGVPGRQVVKALGSRSGRGSHDRARVAFKRNIARERCYERERGDVMDDAVDVVVEAMESRAAAPESVKPLDGVSVSLDSDEREMVIVADGREHRVPIGVNWSFC